MSIVPATSAAKAVIKPTAKLIAAELVRGRGPFPYSRFIAVENVSWGFVTWEADLLACSSSGYLYEVEIKVSIADLKRDRSKRRWVVGSGINERVRGMWFAMPPEIWAHKDAAAAVPADCGVIVVDLNAETYSGACRIERPCKRQPARKLNDRECLQLARLGVMRYWSRGASA